MANINGNTDTLVFLTGASGFIGFRTLVTALEKGYKVRASVRSEKQFDTIRAPKSIQPYLSNLELVLVPSITESSAFDEVLKGVTHILHVASPLATPTADYERDLLEPALKGTLSILESAKKVATVKRVVITSSAVATMSFTELAVTDDKIHYDDEKAANASPPFNIGGPFEAYCASKIAAHNATDTFVENEKPHFDIIRVSPSFVLGRNDLLTSAEQILASGTSRFGVWPALGNTRPQPTPGTTVHVDDVALAHVLALDPKVKGGQNFIASSHGPNGIVWDDQLEIIKRNFPKQVESGLFPLSGSQPSKRTRIDATRTENVLGFKFQDFEEQVKTVAQQYVDLQV